MIGQNKYDYTNLLLVSVEKKEKDGVEVDIQAELARLQSEQESKRQVGSHGNTRISFTS